MLQQQPSTGAHLEVACDQHQQFLLASSPRLGPSRPSPLLDPAALG
jgi:hypothetical protein